MAWFSQNKKMKQSSTDSYRVYNWTLPAYQSTDGFITCPYAGECATGCYAQQGAYRWNNVSAKHHKNLALTQSEHFMSEMLNEIATLERNATRAGKQLVIRIHDSGDFYSWKYLQDWLLIIDQFPEVIFYAYTKALPLFRVARQDRDVPENFTVIYSEGGKFDKYIQPNLHRHSRIFPDKRSLLDAGYVDTTENDLHAIGPNKKIGLVYHGAKSKTFTTNKKGD